MRLIITIVMTAITAFAQPAKVENKLRALNVGVLEFRNYLLRPNSAERFRTLFNERFVEPMSALGGYTVGQYAIEGERDHFVWIRAFENMHTRVDFLNAFYLNDPVWKQYRPDANGMIINNDNVHLLRPLETGTEVGDLKKLQPIVVVDFYVSNTHLAETIDLFRKEYLPYLKAEALPTPMLFVSELAENDFPRLPVFQDKNLLVAMTGYASEGEYDRTLKKLDSVPEKLHNSMLELITTRSRLVLHSTIQGDK